MFCRSHSACEKKQNSVFFFTFFFADLKVKRTGGGNGNTVVKESKKEIEKRLMSVGRGGKEVK